MEQQLQIKMKTNRMKMNRKLIEECVE